MTLPYIVVDQNQLRDADAIASALDRCCRENLQILIPEGAGFELSTSGDPHQNWIRCLHNLAPYAELVVVGRKITHIWRDEIEMGYACGDIVEDGTTTRFRTLLQQIASGDDSGVRGVIDGPLKQLLAASPTHCWSHDKNKSMMLTLRDSLRSSLTKAKIKGFRNDTVDAVIDWLSSADGVKFVCQGIQSCGASPETALQLSVVPSAMGGFVSGTGAMGLYWLAFGGLEAAKPKAVSNDLHDIEYVILGALSDSLLSIDKRLNVIHEVVTAATVGRAQWFARALVVGPERA